MEAIIKKLMEQYDKVDRMIGKQYIGDGLYLGKDNKLYHRIDGTNRYFEVAFIRC